ncbi:hypothetical protein ACQF36_41200, partial [Streptomyces sp. Marseille-Q5077]|uniref:hypothetical protein n=1 Tax=Streptomyces sp. Marseille-Q5077 TaxID=3418995 RepID=UPI003D04480B
PPVAPGHLPGPPPAGPPPRRRPAPPPPRRGPAIADAAGRYAFPAYAVDAESLRLGEECLRDGDPVPALRRRLADHLDDLARALRVREGREG